MRGGNEGEALYRRPDPVARGGGGGGGGAGHSGNVAWLAFFLG